MTEQNKSNQNQKGITGLETAIILIAFVMVASVLSYVVLSAGLFSSQKAKEAINAGLQQTGSTLELKGNVITKMEEGIATEVYFTLSTISGGSPVDMTDTTDEENVVTISYSDSFNQYPALDWTMEIINNNNGDSILDPGELAQIIVDLSAVNDGAADDSEKLGAYHSFTLEVKPPDGAVLAIERTIPMRVNQLVNLH